MDQGGEAATSSVVESCDLFRSLRPVDDVADERTELFALPREPTCRRDGKGTSMTDVKDGTSIIDIMSTLRRPSFGT